jgi:hypothetical protein
MEVSLEDLIIDITETNAKEILAGEDSLSGNTPAVSEPK